MFKILSTLAVLLALGAGSQAAMPQAPPVRETASEANDDAYDASGLQPIATQFQPVAMQLQSCPGGRCPVATAVGSVGTAVAGRVVEAGDAVSRARPRLFANKPVRTFLGRIFGLNRCR